MAKENYISLRGQIRSEVIYVKNENDFPIKAFFSLHTIKRNAHNRAGQLEPKFDKPIIMTSDPVIIRETLKINRGDIIEVKGSFTTGKVIKHKKCPYCGFENDFETPYQVITPQYIGVLKTGLKSDSEGLKDLVETAEISNVAKIIGRVCSEKIINGESERGDLFATYQLAVNRKYYLPGTEDYDDHSDYLYVISYNDQAIDDTKALKEGALIYVDGYVHTMLTPMKVTCANEECHRDFEIKTQRMSITPYSVEYLRDYNGDAIEQTHPTSDENIKVDEPEII